MTARRMVRIRVRGTLSQRLSASFDGMALQPSGGDTEIVGEVVDQAQLHGLLTRVRDLGLELGAVIVLDPDRSATPDMDQPAPERS